MDIDKLNISELQTLLGRYPHKDERDKSFPMKAALPKTTSRSYKYWWANGWWGDQLETPECVAYAWLHALEDGGITQDIAPAPVIKPKWYYDQCQLNDEWAGTNYEGTSVRAGAKIAKREGFISGYTWTWDVNVMIQAIMTTGPVVVGTNWYYDMFFPDKTGILKIGNHPMGGHAYIANGYNHKTEMIRCKNSWGREWGKKGFFYIHKNDMQRLLNEYGECCLPIEIKKAT